MTCRDGDLSPHCFSLYRQLRPAALSSLWCVLNASDRGHFHTSTARHYGTVGSCANADCCYTNRNQTPAPPLTVLAAASWNEAQILPLLSQAPGLLYQPSCLSSGKALNAQSPQGNHKKFKPPLASKFLATASLQNSSSETAIVWQNSRGSTGEHIPIKCNWEQL